MKRSIGISACSTGARPALAFLTLCVSAFWIAPANAQWLDSLPAHAQAQILWSTDLEDGTVDAWTQPEFRYAGGGIFNTGPPDEAYVSVESTIAHSGAYAVLSVIHNAYRARAKRAVRLMRWTDRAWDDDGVPFPASAYYSTWMYFPENYDPAKAPPWDPGDGGWWNVFQFKSDDSDGTSQPLWTLNVENIDGKMSFYLYTKYNTPASHAQSNPKPIPVGKWVHVEAFYKQSTGNQGEVAFWQDGTRILHVTGVRTKLADDAVWGLGNYTDHIDGGATPGTAELWFDDVAVSQQRLSQYLSTPPQPPPPSGNAIVTVSAADRSAAESLLNKGRIRVSRYVDRSGELTVRLNVSGTASPGLDYRALPSSVRFEDGQKQIMLDVIPIDDTRAERAETVRVTLEPGEFRFGRSTSATVRIRDDD